MPRALTLLARALSHVHRALRSGDTLLWYLVRGLGLAVAKPRIGLGTSLNPFGSIIPGIRGPNQIGNLTLCLEFQ